MADVITAYRIPYLCAAPCKTKIFISLPLPVQHCNVTGLLHFLQPVLHESLHVAFPPCFGMHGNGPHKTRPERMSRYHELFRQNRDLSPQLTVFICRHPMNKGGIHTFPVYLGYQRFKIMRTMSRAENIIGQFYTGIFFFRPRYSVFTHSF